MHLGSTINSVAVSVIREAFRKLAHEILTNPAHTFDHVMTRGGQAAKGFVGKVDGENVVIFVAKEALGKVKAGDIITSYKSSPQKLKNYLK